MHDKKTIRIFFFLLLIFVRSPWHHSVFIIGWWDSNPEQRLWGHYNLSLLSLKLLCSVSACAPSLMKFKVLVILRPAALDPLAPRDASSPVPPTFPSVASSASDSESVNAFVPGSAASDSSALSRAPFQSIPVCYHHLWDTCAPG